MAKTFRMLEQPCALRLRDEPAEPEPESATYDLPLPDSDYNAAADQPPRSARRPPARPQDGGSGG